MFRLSRQKLLQVLKNKAPEGIQLPQTSKFTQLENGLRVASIDLKIPTMTVGLWCNCGSRYEDLQNNGVAHYFEHLVFKGSQGMTRDVLEETVENKGQRLMAYTSREQTVYFAKGFSSDAEEMVDLLSNIVQKPTLSTKAIEEERGVILAEIDDIAQNQEETVYDYLHDVCFRGTPLSFPILGPKENVKGLQRHEILDFVKQHYITDRMVLAAAGGIDHNSLCEMGNRLFEKSTMPPPPKPKGTEFKPGLKYQVVPSMPYVHIAFVCESAKWTSPDTLPLMLASQMIGQWDRSSGAGAIGSKTVLTTKFERESLALSFKAFNTIYVDIGLFGCYLVVDNPTEDPDRAKKAIQVIRQEFENYATPGYLDKETVELAKKTLISQSKMMLEGSEQICEDIGRQILCYGRRVEMEEWEWRINDITVEDVQRSMERYVKDQNFAFSAIGPKVDLGMKPEEEAYIEYF